MSKMEKVLYEYGEEYSYYLIFLIAPVVGTAFLVYSIQLFRKKKKRTGADSPSGLRAVRAMPCAHAHALYHLTSESTRYRYIYPSSRYDYRRPVTTMSVPSSG